MKLEDGIRQLGFRKWYERELLQSHAHMVLAFLCFVGIFALFELISSGANRLFNALLVLVCTAIGAWAVRRYIRLLTRAELIANQADCPGCGTYARFQVVQAEGAWLRPPLASAAHAQSQALEQTQSVWVRCKGCQHQWVIEE